MMPGKKPASAAPSSRRMMKKLASPPMNAMPPEIRPQLSMMRAIQRRAPNFSSARFDGTSKMK